jgi:hypothetical protein
MPANFERSRNWERRYFSLVNEGDEDANEVVGKTHNRSQHLRPCNKWKLVTGPE